jgi:hypothetical protein
MGVKHELGAFGELLVAADLCRRGFAVFQPLSHAFPFDLVGYKHGAFIRIEVKYRRNRVNVGSLSTRARSGVLNCSKFDVLAIVNKGTIKYKRSMDTPLNSASSELVLGPRTQLSTVYEELDIDGSV